MRTLTTLRGAAALAALGAACLGGGARPAGAQSLLASRGLGYPIQPLDARAQGLGGVGLGLPGGELSLVNPAGIAALPAPAISLTFQPDFYSSRAGGTDSDGTTARFPLLHAAFPLGRWTAAFAYGAYLDQTWAVEHADSLRLPGRTLAVTDRFASHGGVTRLRASGAYSFSERLSVGVSADLFTGSVRDTLTRVFERPDTVVTGISIPVSSSYEAEWGYQGLGGSLGVRWVPTDALSLGAAVSGGAKLRARPIGDADSVGSALVGKDYTLPLTFDVGASGRVTQGATLALAGRWAGWSTADDELAAVGGARDSWTVSGGVEFDAARQDRRSFPLRVGARYSALPFRWGTGAAASEFPAERAVTAGLGARLAGGAALVDLAGERGWRGGGSATLDESYWRLSLSLTLLGR